MGRYYTGGAKAAPEQVDFEVTAGCNLACVHCYNNSGSREKRQELSHEQRLNTAREIAAFKPVNVCFCGGEATCLPYLFELIDIVRPAAARVSLVTNGFLVTEAMAAKLAGHGVDMVQISLDGATAWQHDSFRGVTGAFRRALAAVKNLQQAGIQLINTSFIPNRLNHTSLPQYLELLQSIGVGDARIMPFIPLGRGLTVGRRFQLTAEEGWRFCRELLRLRREYAGRLIIRWGDPIEHVRTRPEAAAQGISSQVLDIRANGDIVISPYLPLAAGNVSRHSLAEYWQAGFDRIWTNEKYTCCTGTVHNLFDVASYKERLGTGDSQMLDLLAEE